MQTPPVTERCTSSDHPIRVATTRDRDQIIELSVDAHGGPERWGITALLDAEEVGCDRFVVATCGDRVVSTMGLLERELVVREGDDEVRLPCGQPEYVATEPDHRRLGLVRRQMDELHRWSAERGDLVQIIVGIPYFYRRLGYEQALAMPLVDVRPDLRTPKGALARPATIDDLAAVMALDAAQDRASDVAAPLTEVAWRRYIIGGAGCGYRVIVVERSGEVAAVGLFADWGEPVVYVGQVAGRDPKAVSDLVGACNEAAAPRRTRFVSRPGAPAAALAGVGTPAGPYSVYARVTDRLALLDALRPVLDARLATSGWAQWSGRTVLSVFEEGLAIEVQSGRVAGIERVAGHHDPSDDGQRACPPDAFVTLILGRHGAAGLEDRLDDVSLGAHRDLMGTLFPMQRHHVGTLI